MSDGLDYSSKSHALWHLRIERRRDATQFNKSINNPDPRLFLEPFVLRAKRLSTLSELASDSRELAISSIISGQLGSPLTHICNDCAEERSDSARLFLEGFCTVCNFGQKVRKQLAKVGKRGPLLYPRLPTFASYLRTFLPKIAGAGRRHFDAKKSPKSGAKFWPIVGQKSTSFARFSSFWSKMASSQICPKMTLNLPKLDAKRPK